MKLTRDGRQCYISLNKNDYINKSLLDIVNSENIQSGWINGIGAIDDVEIGYFDIKKKDYVKKKFLGDYELLSLSGNVSIKNGNKFIHTHISFSDTNFKVFGGHLFDAKITAAGEFFINSCNIEIIREYNKDIGLHLWCMNNE